MPSIALSGTIRLKYFGDEHPSVATLYNNIGGVWRGKSEFYLAQKYYKKCLDIRLKTLGGEHPEVADSYFSLGNMYKNLYKFDLAIVNYQKGFFIEKKGGFPYKIAQCFEALNKQKKALDYYIQSAEIRKNHPKVGLDDEATQESISNSKRLAKVLGKEEELPEWIKKTN